MNGDLGLEYTIYENTEDEMVEVIRYLTQGKFDESAVRKMIKYTKRYARLKRAA